MNSKKLVLILLSVSVLAACSPEVGSDKWCAMLEEKPTGDWTVTEAGDYAKHCLFK